MLRTPLMLATAAGALIMVQAPAVAQEQCGGIWAARCNLPKGPKKAEKVKDVAPAADENAAANANANPNSAVAGATPPKASATGVANAAPNSAAATGTTGADANAAVIAGAGSLGAAALGGISTGQAVKSSDGTALGKISQVIKGGDGAISRVIVTSPSGRSFPVAASKLSVSGGAVIVTDTDQ